jgi:hypothetical protein
MGANLSVNGERGPANNFEIDGQSTNDNSKTDPQVLFSNQDASQEIEGITNYFSAQIERNLERRKSRCQFKIRRSYKF